MPTAIRQQALVKGCAGPTRSVLGQAPVVLVFAVKFSPPGFHRLSCNTLFVMLVREQCVLKVIKTRTHADVSAEPALACLILR